MITIEIETAVAKLKESVNPAKSYIFSKNEPTKASLFKTRSNIGISAATPTNSITALNGTRRATFNPFFLYS